MQVHDYILEDDILQIDFIAQLVSALFGFV